MRAGIRYRGGLANRDRVPFPGNASRRSRDPPRPDRASRGGVSRRPRLAGRADRRARRAPPPMSRRRRFEQWRRSGEDLWLRHDPFPLGVDGEGAIDPDDEEVAPPPPLPPNTPPITWREHLATLHHALAAPTSPATAAWPP